MGTICIILAISQLSDINSTNTHAVAKEHLSHRLYTPHKQPSCPSLVFPSFSVVVPPQVSATTSTALAEAPGLLRRRQRATPTVPLPRSRATSPVVLPSMLRTTSRATANKLAPKLTRLSPRPIARHQ